MSTSPASHGVRPPGGDQKTVAGKVKRVTIGAWIIYALFVVLLAQKFFGGTREIKEFVDLLVYQGAIQDLIHHGTLYNFADDQQLPFTYPPFAAVLLFPIAYVNATVLACIWTALTIVSAGVIAYLIAPQVAQRLAEHWNPALWRRSPVLPLTFLVVLAVGPTQSNLENGQVSIFIVLATLVDTARLAPERYRGIATGMAGAIKLVPMIFVPYLWITGQRRAAVTATGTFLACTGLAWAILPGDSIRYWFTELWAFDRVDPHNSFGNISLHSLIPVTRLSHGGQTVLWLLLSLVVLVVGMYRARRASAAGNTILGAAIIGSISIVISPVSWEHHAIWLVIAVCAIPFRDPRKWSGWAIVCIVVLALARPYYLVTLTHFAGSYTPAIIAGILMSKAQLYFAIAVACLLPFQELRSSKTGNGSVFVKEDLANVSLDHA